MGRFSSDQHTLASLQFGGLDWLPLAAGLALAGCLVAWWANRRTWAAMGAAGKVCAALKCGGFILLALCLLQPQWVGERPVQGENVVALLVDNGRGLTVGSKGEELGGALEAGTREAGWLEQLGETFAVEQFEFDDGVRPAAAGEVPGFDGRASGLDAALRSVAARLGSRHLAAVLVFTDGVATDWPEGGTAAGGGLPPVFPVVPEADDEPDDVAISDLAVTTSPFEDAPVEVRATVAARGTAPDEIEVVVTDSDGAEVARETPGAGGVARLRFRPVMPGVSFFKVEARRAGGRGGGEATLANNVRHVAVDHGGESRRLLYVAGRPNWEFKFLRRALEEDAEIDLVGLIRVAKREPKFEFRGRSGESSNPLFRGFGPAGQAPEYDQPVLQRMNTRDEEELADGFPRTAEELFAYDGIVLDDLEAEFFSPDQLALIRKFVAQRGGGFLMLGGQESLAAGGYDQTPVADVLPLSVRPGRAPAAADGVAGGGRLPWDLTRDGLLEPWVRLRDTVDEELERIGAMPGFLTLNQTGRAKPGAALLVESGDRPALAAHRFGRGRAAALAVGDFWRWGFKDPEQRPDMEKAWRQLVRWLLADVPGRVGLDVGRAAGADGVSAVRATVRDPEFEPDPEVDVHLEVTLPGGEGGDSSEGEKVTLTAGPDEGGEPGEFVSDVRATDAGGYHVRATATRYDGTTAGVREAGWAHNPDADEFASLGVNRGLLDELARATGGRVLRPADLPAFAQELPDSEQLAVETTRLDLWHVPVTFLLGLGLLAAEWAVRRTRGYA